MVPNDDSLLCLRRDDTSFRVALRIDDSISVGLEYGQYVAIAKTMLGGTAMPSFAAAAAKPSPTAAPINAPLLRQGRQDDQRLRQLGPPLEIASHYSTLPVTLTRTERARETLVSLRRHRHTRALTGQECRALPKRQYWTR